TVLGSRRTSRYGTAAAAGSAPSACSIRARSSRRSRSATRRGHTSRWASHSVGQPDLGHPATGQRRSLSVVSWGAGCPAPAAARRRRTRTPPRAPRSAPGTTVLDDYNAYLAWVAEAVRIRRSRERGVTGPVLLSGHARVLAVEPGHDGTPTVLAT